MRLSAALPPPAVKLVLSAAIKQRQAPISRWSDETEATEFSERSQGRMDVTGSGGHTHVHVRMNQDKATYSSSVCLLEQLV